MRLGRRRASEPEDASDATIYPDAVLAETVPDTVHELDADPDVDPDAADLKVAAEPSGDSLDAHPQGTPARTGRNLWAAAGFGLLMFAGVLAAARWHPLALAIVLYAFCIGAVIEWRRALDRSGRQVSLVPILGAIVGMGIATWYGGSEGLIVALLVGCAGVVAWRVVDERIENTMADSLASMFTLMWIPFLGSFVLLLALAHDGWQRVFILLVAVSGNDTGGLFAGMRFGRRKLAPAISPNKTWEGAIGGFVVGTIAASITAYFLFDGAWITGALVGAATTVAAVVGDLSESAIKRDISVKDMSSVIPGHGGILDRLDSILVAAPVAFVVFALLIGST